MIIDNMGTSPENMANFYENNKMLVEMNDARMAQRHQNGVVYRDFLIKCAYFYAVQNRMSINEFADIARISVAAARQFADKTQRVYRYHMELLPEIKFSNKEKQEKKERRASNFLEKLAKAKERAST